MNNFTWTDLSTFDVEKTKKFYSEIFAWDFYEEKNKFGEKYHIGYLGEEAIAGIYEMPKKFVDINTPSFWMSYIRVEKIQEVVDLARSIHGGLVEVDVTPFADGKMALVRDPSGAGFTLYEGESLYARESKESCVSWNIHHVKNIELVRDFYEKILLWGIRKSAYENRYSVFSADTHIADI